MLLHNADRDANSRSLPFIKGFNMLEKIVEKFVTIDPRKSRPAGYAPSLEFNIKRFSGLLPPDLVKNKHVLDLGSCVSASGGWALHHGCKHFTGVEIQKELHDVATQAMSEFFQDRWTLINQEIEEFVAQDDQKYDVILMSGVNHCLGDFMKILEWCTQHSDYIIIEGSNPHLYADMLTQTLDANIYDDKDRDYLHTLLESRVFSEWFRDLIENKLPIMHFRNSTSVFATKNLEFGFAPPVFGAYHNPGWFKNFFSVLGWQYENSHHDHLKQNLSDYYIFPHRYCVAFSKQSDAKRMVLKDHFKDGMLR